MTVTESGRGTLTTPRVPATVSHLATAWALYAALAVVAVTAPWYVRVPAWLTMAWLLVGNGAIVHETTHRHLFRSSTANRWVGAIAGASVLMPWGVYRPYHLAHHRYTVAIEDPEGPPLHFRARVEYPLLALGGVAFLVRLTGYGVATAAARPPSWVRSRAQRHAAVADTALCLAVLVGLVLLGFWKPGVLVAVWLVPWLVALMALVPLVLVTEHYGATVGTVNAAENTRSVVSNRVVRWLYWNNNFHTAHHQLPAAVHQRLPELEQLIDPGTRGDWLVSGYLAFHRRVWSSLPWFAPAGEVVDAVEEPRHTPLR